MNNPYSTKRFSGGAVRLVKAMNVGASREGLNSCYLNCLCPSLLVNLNSNWIGL